MDCAALWTIVDGRVHPDFGSIMLDRSKQASLTVEAKYPVKGFDGVYRKALSQGHRMQSVTFDTTVYTGKAVERIMSACVGQAPLVERLILSWYSQSFEPPAGIFRDGAPSLRELSVSCRLPWSSLPPSTSNLQFLSIKSPEYRRLGESLIELRPSAQEFSDYLQNAHSLVELKLTNRLPHDSVAASHPRIKLPNLKNIFLCDTTQALVTFFLEG